MLQGISPLLSPELLFVLHSMGHGDEIVLADANFPGVTMNTTCLRADGVQIAPLLHALLPLFPLDTFCGSPSTYDASGTRRQCRSCNRATVQAGY